MRTCFFLFVLLTVCYQKTLLIANPFLENLQTKQNELLVNGIEATATDNYKEIFRKKFNFYLEKYKNQNLALKKAIYESDNNQFKQSLPIFRDVKSYELIKFFKPLGIKSDLDSIGSYLDAIDTSTQYNIECFRELAGALSDLLTINQIKYLALNLKKAGKPGIISSNLIKRSIIYALEEHEIP
jgi:hypothetical protein